MYSKLVIIAKYAGPDSPWIDLYCNIDCLSVDYTFYYKAAN